MRDAIYLSAEERIWLMVAMKLLETKDFSAYERAKLHKLWNKIKGGNEK